MVVIDGTDQILGRVATFAAKKALEGEKVDIVNCEKVIITGTKDSLITKFKWRLEVGDPHKGPYYPRRADMMVRRAIRGMLPFKYPRGKEAYRRVMCYLGVPKDIKEKPISLKDADMKKLDTLNYMTIGQLSKYIGGK